MTTAKTISNIVLGGSVTVYTTSVEKVFLKKITGITAPQSTANYGSGPKDTKIVDLLRIEGRFTVNGKIDSADESTLEGLFNAGGTFSMSWKGTSYNINMEKLSLTNKNDQEQDETDIMFTAIVGVDF